MRPYDSAHSVDATGVQDDPDIDQRITSFLVGVGGGTGAGKTTFSIRLAKALSTESTVTVVDLVSYQAGWPSLPVNERQGLHLEGPESLNLIGFYTDLDRLKQRQPCIMPMSDIPAYTSHSHSAESAPADIIIAEGSLVFVNEPLRKLFDLRIFIDTPPDIRLRRRLEREVREKGCDLADAIDHYMAFVLPIHDHFIEPSKHTSDIVVPGWGGADLSFDDLISRILRRVRSIEIPSQSLPSMSGGSVRLSR